jgi:hypothetical protein
MPYELKAFNFDDVEINLQSAYTVLIPHDGHENIERYDLTRLFDNINAHSAIWWDVLGSGVVINAGDQLFSVTIPSLPGDTLRDRQVKYFEIVWEQQSRSAGFIILRNGVMVYDDGPTIDGYGTVVFTKRYDLPLPDVLA